MSFHKIFHKIFVRKFGVLVSYLNFKHQIVDNLFSWHHIGQLPIMGESLCFLFVKLSVTSVKF